MRQKKIFKRARNHISLQKELKIVVTDEFFRSTVSVTRITTRNMTDYKVKQSL
jgi:C4-type Zn-finger protein